MRRFSTPALTIMFMRIVITGKVEKFFSAGADINMLSSKSLGFQEQLRSARP